LERNPEINDDSIVAMEIPKDFLICHSREPSCNGPRNKKNHNINAFTLLTQLPAHFLGEVMLQKDGLYHSWESFRSAGR